MSHMTKKKLKQRELNNKGRAIVATFNLGTRYMGFPSNNARKAAMHLDANKY